MKEIPDTETLADDLNSEGLIGVILRHDARRFSEGYEDFLEQLASILNRPGAPSVDVGLEATLKTLSGFSFFSVQDVLCGLIPRLETDHRPLLRLVDKLVQAGGADLAAGQPNAALRSWCAADPRRSAAICADARNGDVMALKHLTFALEAQADIEEATRFADSNQLEARLAAATALGRMNLGSEVAGALETLVKLANESDEQLSLNALAAGFGAAERANVEVPIYFEDALEKRLSERTPQTIHFAADLLWKHAKVLSNRALDICLTAVEAIDPQHKGTIDHLDFAARSLAEIGLVDRMVELVGRICDRTEGAISLSSFDGLMHQLKSRGAETLGRAVVFWLLHGEVHTRKSLALELTEVGRDKPSYSVPRDCLPAEAAMQLFLCRKAIGWFFSDPLSAIPIPLSILRNGAPEIANDVCDLILDPLLLSYGGKLKDHLEAAVKSDPLLAAYLPKIIEEKNAIQKAAEGSEGIVELRPSETHRETERVLWHKQMQDGMENANKKSILHDLFAKQYILYGRSTLFTVDGGDGRTELVESEMKSFSVSAELPLLEIFDPAGLRHALWRMRFEARPDA